MVDFDVLNGREADVTIRLYHVDLKLLKDIRDTGGIILAIKTARAIYRGLGLLDAKNLIEGM